MYRQAFNHCAAKARCLHFLFSFQDIIYWPDIADGNMMEGRDYTCCASLAYIMQAYGIIGSKPAHGLFH